WSSDVCSSDLILQPHAAQFGIVKARLDGDDLAGPQPASRVRPHARGFVDFQTEAVAGAMEKPLHPPVALGGFVTCLLEELLDRLMHFDRLHAGPHLLERQLLSLANDVVEFLDRLAGATAHDGAGDVAEIAGFLRAGKDIED